MTNENIIEMTNERGVVVMGFKAPSISNVEEIAAASAQIGQFIEQNKPRKVVFDFDGVRFFSSQVLGLLLQIRKSLAEYDGKVVISAIDPQLHRVFRITNLDKIFLFFANKEKAIQAISAD